MKNNELSCWAGLYINHSWFTRLVVTSCYSQHNMGDKIKQPTTKWLYIYTSLDTITQPCTTNYNHIGWVVYQPSMIYQFRYHNTALYIKLQPNGWVVYINHSWYTSLDTITQPCTTNYNHIGWVVYQPSMKYYEWHDINGIPQHNRLQRN